MKTMSTTIIGEQDIFQAGLAATLQLSRFKASRNINFVKRDTLLEAKGLALVLVIEPKDEHKAAEETIATLRDAHPDSCIVLLAVRNGDTRWAFEAGADGCLPHTISAHALVVALELLLCKEVAVGTMGPIVKHESAPARRQLPAIRVDTPGTARLSQREREVLSCIARGDSNKRIARALEICEATVKGHIRTVLRKIGASNRTQAAVMAGELLVPTLLNSRVNGHC